MKKVFVDTNVLLDVMEQREGFYIESSEIMQLGYDKKILIYTTSLSFANCYYILRKVIGKEKAMETLRFFKTFITIAPMDNPLCEQALSAIAPDFEDMLQYEAAIASKCDVLVTRDQKHFPKDSIPVLSPHEFIMHS